MALDFYKVCYNNFIVRHYYTQEDVEVFLEKGKITLEQYEELLRLRSEQELGNPV